MSTEELHEIDGADLNESDRDAAHFEATHDGADWTDDDGPRAPVFLPGQRVMWDHGHGVPGTVRPRGEWPYADQLDAHPESAFVEWDDGATTLVVPSALALVTFAGPTPYPDDFGDEAPF